MKARTRSVAVEMRDGVKLAVDTILPVEGEAFPVVLIQTRYWRSFLARGQRGGPMGSVPPSAHSPKVETLVGAGFAVVAADVRGTGASEGSWPIMWSDAEADDASDLVSWIAEQPFCNGKVVAAGLSYEATTAVLAAACGHDAMVGAVARGFEWDVFDDILAPGGVVNSGFLKAWSEACDDLDHNIPPHLFGAWRLLLKGVRPLDEDPDGTQLAALVAARDNPTVWQSAQAMKAPTDPYGVSGKSIADVSLVHRPWVRERLAPTQLWASWLDGTTARAVLRMWEAIDAVREVAIGAWSHTAEEGASLGKKHKADPPLKAQQAEQVEFLKHCVAGDASQLPRQLRYFTMGEEAWHTATTWPPEGVTDVTYFLNAERKLVLDAVASAHRTHRPSRQTTTGTANRWHTQNARPVDIPRRARMAKEMLTWRTSPFEEDVTLTGEPVLSMTMAASYDQAAVFGYLELVDRRGRVHYVTEAIQRCAADADTLVAVTLRFLPTSVRIPKGWRLQLGLAATDADTLPVELPPGAVWKVLVGGDKPATLTLPFEPPAAATP